MSDEPGATAQGPRRSSRISARTSTKVDVSAPVKKSRKPSKAQRQIEAEEVENNKEVRHSNLKSGFSSSD